MSAVWEQLVVTATVGTDAGPVRTEEFSGSLGGALRALPSAAPAVAVLDAAAVATVARWAGARHGAAGGQVSVAPPDARPALPVRAADVVRRIFQDVADSRSEPALLHALLAVVGAGGWRLPVDVLPALLSRASADEEMREYAAEALGAQAWWLAEQNSAWRVLAAYLTGLRAQPDQLREEHWWRKGTEAQRAAFFTGVRRVNPAAAGLLLAETWAALAEADRTRLLPLLVVGLSSADESFLESVRSESSDSRRQEANRLLERLPESARAARMWQRAQTLVQRKRGLLGSRWELRAPEPQEADLEGDSTGPEKAQVRSSGTASAPQQRLIALRTLLAGAPLLSWSVAFSAEPAEFVAGVAGDRDLGVVYVDGLTRAAVGQFLSSGSAAGERDFAVSGAFEQVVRPTDPAVAEWAVALFDQSLRIQDFEPHRRGQLLSLLPLNHRLAIVLRELRGAANSSSSSSSSSSSTRLGPMLAALPGPWPQELAQAAGEWLSKQPPMQSNFPPAPVPVPAAPSPAQRPHDAWPPTPMLQLFGRRFPIGVAPMDHAGALTALAQQADHESRWREPVLAAAQNIERRRQFFQELG